MRKEFINLPNLLIQTRIIKYKIGIINKNKIMKKQKILLISTLKIQSRIQEVSSN